MSERRRPPVATWSLERDLAELHAEAACADPDERVITDRDRRREPLLDLPEVWQAIYGEDCGFLALFSGTRRGTRLALPRTAYFPWPDGASRGLDWVAREVASEREVYQTAHLLLRARRRKADAAPLGALWVDLDHDTLPPGFPLPTVAVASSPGRLQCYWRLTTPVPPAEGELLNRRLAHTLAADPSGYDLTQLLRVPFTTNHKYPERPLVRLLALNHSRHDPTTFAALLRELPNRTEAQTRSTDAAAAPAAAALEPPVPLPRAALPIWNGVDAKRTPDGRIDRSASLVRIARVLADAGASREVIVAALSERDGALSWRKYAGREDAAAQYARIAALVAQPRQSRAPYRTLAQAGPRTDHDPPATIPPHAPSHGKDAERSWEPTDFRLEPTTMRSSPERGRWATHDGGYHGN